jgi:hypothetical protein
MLARTPAYVCGLDAALMLGAQPPILLDFHSVACFLAS